MISVIIPTYNEEKVIEGLLLELSNNNLEIIVSDGGSSDRTLAIAKKFDVQIVVSKRLRSAQLNAGARHASGSVLLFLHADCRLEEGFSQKALDSINNGFIGGCFSQVINSSKLIYRFIERSGNLRAKVFKIFYGDQAIFVRCDIFAKMRGFDEVEIFEDVLFSKRLRKEGKVCVLSDEIYASSRRWEAGGIIKTTLLNWLISLGFIFGLSPNVLKKVYQDIR